MTVSISAADLATLAAGGSVSIQGPTSTPTPSPSGTTIAAGSAVALIDTAGNRWTITATAQVAVNGTADPNTSGVALLAYVNGLVWQQNTGGTWYSTTGPNTVWGPPGGTKTSPLASPSQSTPPPTPPATPPATGTQYKFGGAMDWLLVSQYGGQNDGSTENDLGWIERYVTEPADGLATQVQMSDVNNGPVFDGSVENATKGAGNYLGFRTRLGASFNLHQVKNPDEPWAFFDNTACIWQGDVPTGDMTCSISDWILNCKGKLTLPDTFGGTETTDYSFYVYPNGQCGFNFYAYNPTQGPNYYDFLIGAYQNPGFVQARKLHKQALALYQWQVPMDYAAGTQFYLGDLVEVGTQAYVALKAMNPTPKAPNPPVTDSTSWAPITLKYRGKTLDEIGIILWLNNNDETSADFSKGPWKSGSVSAADALTGENYINGYLQCSMDTAAIFPHTPNGTNDTYVITGVDGVTYDARPCWINGLAKLFSVPGTAFSQSDLAPNSFAPGKSACSNAMRALCGLDPDNDYTAAPYNGTFPAFGSYAHNYVDEVLKIGQTQPQDFGTTPAQIAQNVVGICNTLAAIKSNYRVWCSQTNNWNTTDWTLMRNAFKAAGPAVSTRPTALP
jgi:hypothetical protein